MQIRKMDLLRPGQVAELLGVSTKTVMRWADSGRLKCTRLESGHRRFRAAVVIAFMQQRNKTTTTEEG